MGARNGERLAVFGDVGTDVIAPRSMAVHGEGTGERELIASGTSVLDGGRDLGNRDVVGSTIEVSARASRSIPPVLDTTV